ncbi:MAG TPA: S9 family peptidase [Cellvibrio sp.]|nr:S9 family peptidase [Cellvibrio sp.]
MYLLPRFHRPMAAALALLLGCLSQSLFAADAAPAHKPLPLDVFYKDALVEDIELSPDGTHLVALKNIAGATVVMVLEIATGKAFYPVNTDNKQFKFNWVSWANNERLLMSLRFDSRMTNGVKYMQTRLLAIDAKQDDKPITLVKPDDDAGWVSQFQDNVISYLPDDPEHILISVDREMPLHQTVYKANVYTGKLTRVKKHSHTVRSWYADRAGNVRIGEHYDDDKRKVTYKVLDPATNQWVIAWEYVVLDEPDIDIAGFGHNPNELFIFADHEGRRALFRADLSKPGYPKELVLSDPNYDVSGRLIYSTAHKQVVGLYYNDGSAKKSIFWNKEFKAFQAGLDKVLPDSTNYIASISDDARKYVLYTSSPTNPGTYFFGNRDDKSLVPIANAYPDLTEAVLVEKETRNYKARDGLELQGFLSLPKNFPNKPTATIILPHGGPMCEDGKDFDMFSTFMANRGYVVFQPNFRGSSGYGHDFMMQAVGGYGLEMQDDLEDAVKYLVDEKIADPQKVCIVGASYGGYAALMGATKTPDLFRCAISFAGMSDLVRMRDSFRSFSNSNTARKQFGEDKKQLKETSPVRMAEKVKIPILLIHGKDDTTVPVAQSRIMADALKSEGKVYEYIELENGTHYLDYFPDRKQTFEAMENFLKKYLPI